MLVFANPGFGKWGDILAVAAPADPLLYCTTAATRFYARGVAYAALGATCHLVGTPLARDRFM